jgi:hypothetical protein
LKLNELVAAVKGASNRLIDVEELSEQEIATLHRHFALLAKRWGEEVSVGESHSIEEAEKRHAEKLAGREKRSA